VSACKTGCGRPTLPSSRLCDTCFDEWQTRGPGRESEQVRYTFYMHNPAAQAVALVDFCNRVRAERKPGGEP
jgi:hypothetical protein